MYLAMNRFKVKLGREDAFETVWTSRESRLADVPGFVSFHLLKGEAGEGYRLYASHSVWQSEDAFRDWTRSAAFRDAHRGAGDHGDMYLGPPQLEVFRSVQALER